MKFACIAAYRDSFDVTMMCTALGVSRSGFYAHEHSRRSLGPRAQANQQLLVAIRAEHAASHKLYGAPMIHRELREQGVACGRHRVARLMRQVLVDTARARGAVKRGVGQVVAMRDLPDWAPAPDRSVLAMEDALRGLEKTDPLKVRLIEMRFFAGMTAEESSSALAIPVHIVRRELRLARAWLRKEMSGIAGTATAEMLPA